MPRGSDIMLLVDEYVDQSSTRNGSGPATTESIFTPAATVKVSTVTVTEVDPTATPDTIPAWVTPAMPALRLCQVVGCPDRMLPSLSRAVTARVVVPPTGSSALAGVI